MQPIDPDAAAQRLAVVLAYFCIFVGAGIWVPYFPLYLSHLGYSGKEIGSVIGLQPALRWCGALGWAYVADRRRNRHRILVGTAICGTLGYIPLLFAQDIRSVFVILAFIALSHGALIPMLDATVMDHLAGLGGNYGRLRLWGSAGFVIGSVVSAPLVHWCSPSIVPLLLLSPSLLMIWSLRRIPKTQIGTSEHFRPPWHLITPPIATFLLSSLLLQISCGTWGAFFAVHTTSLGFSDTVPGLTYGLAVTFEIGLMYWGRQLIDRYPAANVLLLSLVITVTRWLLTAAATSEPLVIVLQLGHVFSFSAFHLAALRLLARLVPRESSTSGQALYGGVSFGIGGSAGVWLAGALVDRMGTQAAFAVEAAIAFLAIPPALRLRRLHRH